MPTPSDRTTRALVWAIVVLASVVILAVVLVAVLAPSDHVQDTITQVLGVLAPTLAVLVTLRAVSNVQDQVQGVKEDTHALTNGLLDAKVRAATAEVIHPDLVDPDYRHQGLREDLTVRESLDPDRDLPGERP